MISCPCRGRPAWIRSRSAPGSGGGASSSSDHPKFCSSWIARGTPSRSSTCPGGWPNPPGRPRRSCRRRARRSRPSRGTRGGRRGRSVRRRARRRAAATPPHLGYGPRSRGVATARGNRRTTWRARCPAPGPAAPGSRSDAVRPARPGRSSGCASWSGARWAWGRSARPEATRRAERAPAGRPDARRPFPTLNPAQHRATFTAP